MERTSKILGVQDGLSKLIAGIKEAQSILDKKLLTSPVRVSVAGLHQLVRNLGKVWLSMTARKPSANKIHPKSGDTTLRGNVPHFVKFVQDVARLADCDTPSLSQVATALRTSSSSENRKPSRV